VFAVLLQKGGDTAGVFPVVVTFLGVSKILHLNGIQNENELVVVNAWGSNVLHCDPHALLESGLEMVEVSDGHELVVHPSAGARWFGRSSLGFLQSFLVALLLDALGSKLQITNSLTIHLQYLGSVSCIDRVRALDKGASGMVDGLVLGSLL
jgi:hypothetical protein